VHLSADEAVEVVEALQAGPAVEGSGDARLPVGNVVVLADEGGAVAALSQDLGEHRRVLGNLPAVSRVAVSHLRDDTGPGGMVVAPGEQCRAARGAQRGGMEARIAQAHLRYTVQIWRRDLPSKRAPLP